MSKDLSGKYFQVNKKRQQKTAHERYPFKRRKWKKWQYHCEKYKNLSKDEKQKLVDYRKNIIKWDKMLFYNYKKLSFGKFVFFRQAWGWSSWVGYMSYVGKYKKHLC